MPVVASSVTHAKRSSGTAGPTAITCCGLTAKSFEAGVLAHMAGGRRLLANNMYVIMRRIQRLARDNPMRAVEEEALVALVLDERRRSNVPLGDGAYATLAAPGGPLALAAP